MKSSPFVVPTRVSILLQRADKDFPPNFLNKLETVSSNPNVKTTEGVEWDEMVLLLCKNLLAREEIKFSFWTVIFLSPVSFCPVKELISLKRKNESYFLQHEEHSLPFPRQHQWKKMHQNPSKMNKKYWIAWSLNKQFDILLAFLEFEVAWHR